MFESDYGFGDDDPAYGMSDPDISIHDLSWSSSEIDEIADVPMDGDTAIQATTIMLAAITVAQKGSSNSNNNSSQQALNTPRGLEAATHQLRKDRGFRIVIRHLLFTTEPKWIQEQLIADGCMPRFIRVITHRHTGVPMNLFEVELQPTTDGTNEKILHMDRMASQNIMVEKKKRLGIPKTIAAANLFASNVLKNMRQLNAPRQLTHQPSVQIAKVHTLPVTKAVKYLSKNNPNWPLTKIERNLRKYCKMGFFSMDNRHSSQLRQSRSSNCI
ncbi:hypothetical protein ACLKA7_005209 [Drosophila subpalustris]